MLFGLYWMVSRADHAFWQQLSNLRKHPKDDVKGFMTTFRSGMKKRGKSAEPLIVVSTFRVKHLTLFRLSCFRAQACPPCLSLVLDSTMHEVSCLSSRFSPFLHFGMGSPNKEMTGLSQEPFQTAHAVWALLDGLTC